MSVSNEAAHHPGFLPCTARELRTESAHPDAHRYFNKLWRTAGVTLSVSFLDNPEPALRTRILSHMNTWGQKSNVVFRAAGREIGQVRIAREPGGHWSYVGTDLLLIQQDKPTLNLEGFSMSTPEAEFARVVRHLAGLTLGFGHESLPREIIARINRSKAYAYFREAKGWDQRMVEQTIFTPLDEHTSMFTSPGSASVMSYQLPGEVMQDGRAFLGGQDILDSDHSFAERVYPKSRYPY